MKNRIIYLSILGLFLWACAEKSPFPEFEKTESGLYYKMVEEGTGKQVVFNDIVTLDLKYSTDDSVLFDSESYEFPTQLKVIDPAYPGDVMEGFAMMKVGGSAVFKTSADSFFAVIAKVDRPAFIDSGAYLTFEATLQNAQTIEELQAEKAAEAETNKGLEVGLIGNYIEEHNITVEPKESGLYYIETKKGSGEQVQRGQTVTVHYIGRLLTGEKFDASYDRNEPFEFTLGAGQVIPGWDEGIGYMRVGGKATLIVPSSLAYADRPPPGGVIKAYAPLVFDVELLEVK